MTTHPPDADTPPGFLRGQTQVFEDIALGVPLDRCLTRLADVVRGRMPGLRCSVVLLDAAGARLRLAAAPDLPAAFNALVDGMAYDPAVGTCTRAMHTRQLVVTPDIALDPHWHGCHGLAAAHGLRSCWCQPILCPAGRVLGSFALYGGSPGSPDAGERETLQLAAHLAAVAVERDRHAAELRSSEARWRAVFEHSLDAVLVVDDTQRFLDANAAACELFGAGRGDIIGAHMEKFFFPPPAPDHATHWGEFLRTGRHAEECAVRRADGTARQASFRARANVQPGLHLCAIRDITEAQAAARALREAEHLYRSLVETTGTGYAVADEAGRVLDANARYVHLSGHARLDDLRGRTPLEWTAPYDRERFAVALAVCLGQAQPGQIRNLEVDFLRPGGGVVPVDISATAVQTAEGRRALSLCHDITGRTATRRELVSAARELESRVAQRTAQLAQANAQLGARARQQEAVAELGRHALAGMSEEELMAEAAGTVVALLGVEFCGIVEHADPASGQLILRATLGWQAEERIGQPVATTDPGTLAGYALRSPEPVVFEDAATEDRFALGPGMHAKGVASGVTARIGSDPRPFGLIGGHSAAPRQFTCDDVHFMQSVANVIAIAVERQRAEGAVRQAQQAAERANDAKSEFLSRMSHELRTPLNAILGFSQLLEIEPLDAGQRESVEQVTRAGRHLLGLVNEVLDLSRIEAGSFALSPEPLAVDALLREALDLIRPLAEERGVRLLAAPPGPGAGRHILADRQRMCQVLLNLLGNAVKYNHPGGSVHLDAVPAPDGGGRVRVRVRDTGPGIAPEQQARLFTPFERLGAEKTGVEGSGIGLALSKKLVESQGGALGVDSAPGAGSTFWVDLPGAASPTDESDRLDVRLLEEILGAAPPGAAPEPEPAPPRTVLHIDDHEANRALVTMLIARRPGLRLVTAQRGREGLELARAHPAALVLLDLHLPDLPGEAVLAELRADARTRAMPVVIISADAAAVRRYQQGGIGADAYLTKPFNVAQFFSMVDEWTGGKKENGS